MSGASSAPRVEEIHLEKTPAGLGFNIRGGTDNMHVGNDPGIFVTTIKPAGAAAMDGSLHTGDKILELNGEDLREVPHNRAVSAFHRCGDRITLLVEKGAEQRIREQLQAQSSPNEIPRGGDQEEEEEEEQLSPMVVLMREWWWVPVLLGVGGLLVLGYTRRRPNSALAKLLSRRQWRNPSHEGLQ